MQVNYKNCAKEILSGLQHSNSKAQKSTEQKLTAEIKTLQRELTRKGRALAETAALLVLKKNRLNFGGQQGRHISFEDRKQAVDLIMESVASGARKHKACEVLDISIKTLQRWQNDVNGVKKDGRLYTLKIPENKLTSAEKAAIIATVISAKYCDLTPNQIVPKLADQGNYIASEASFYRVLKSANLATYRCKAAPKRHNKPTEYIATTPNQVWSWDIT